MPAALRDAYLKDFNRRAGGNENTRNSRLDLPAFRWVGSKISYSKFSVDYRQERDQPGRARRTRWRQRLASTATRVLASRSQTISSAVWPAAPPALKAPSVARAAASTGSIGGADPSSPAGSDPTSGSLPS